MSQKRKFEAPSPSQGEDTEEVAEKSVIEDSFIESRQEDKEAELELNDSTVQNDCERHLQEILNSLTKDHEYSNQVPKRPRLSIDPLDDSPGSSSVNSIDSHLSDVMDIIDSPLSSSSQVPNINQSTSSTPEVIDLSSPDHVQRSEASSDVVDLTAEPNSPTLINEVVDLTKETVDLLDSSPVILSVNRIFERRSVIQRPSCRFETVVAGNDEVCEVSETLPGNNESSSSSSKPKEDDQINKNVTCPICFDDANLLKRRKRQLSSTFCGHVFCDTCIRNAIKSQNKCPTCRKKLTLRQIHPLFL